MLPVHIVALRLSATAASTPSRLRLVQVQTAHHSFHQGCILRAKRPLPQAVWTPPKPRNSDKARKPSLVKTKPDAATSSRPEFSPSSTQVTPPPSPQQQPRIEQEFEQQPPAPLTTRDNSQASKDPDTANHVPTVATKQFAPPDPSSTTESYRTLLSRTKSPKTIYLAPHSGRLHILAYGSSIFSLWLVKFNLETYLSLSPSYWVLGAGLTVCSIWAALTFWFGAAPAKLLYSIRALPSAKAAVDPKGLGPLLEFQPGAFFPFGNKGRGYGRTKPFALPARDVVRDAAVWAPTEIAVQVEGGRSHSGWRGAMYDMVNVFTRRNFVYIWVPGSGRWKIEVPGKESLGLGRALEEVIDLDEEKKKGLRRLLSR